MKAWMRKHIGVIITAASLLVLLCAYKVGVYNAPHGNGSWELISSYGVDYWYAKKSPEGVYCQVWLSPDGRHTFRALKKSWDSAQMWSVRVDIERNGTMGEPNYSSRYDARVEESFLQPGFSSCIKMFQLLPIGERLVIKKYEPALALLKP